MPANIFVRTNGDVVIADFGCAYFADDAASRYGTLIFTVLELFSETFYKEFLENAAKSDIWSLGLTLAILLWGNIPEKRIGANYVLANELPDYLRLN